ncbi:hypothetical protein [Agrobacterium deltaense]|uniref:hypothetical protein n=1 Tax=Agrobacterium deltaense TaxID=1183412 RepID=UPI00163AAB30|nr:hypothetical protein [Agrobacterium deltaense]
MRYNVCCNAATKKARKAIPGFFYSLPVMNVLPALANFQAILAGRRGELFVPERPRIFSMKEFGHGTHHSNTHWFGRSHI